MNVNFGLFPPLDDARGGRRGKGERKRAYTTRAKAALEAWTGGPSERTGAHAAE